jgi:predicted oxidoreductase
MTDRKMVQKEVSSFDPEYSLKQLKANIENLIESYGENAVISKTSDGWSDYEYLAVFVEVLETDSQMHARLQFEAKCNAEREARDKKEFERLQAKFGSTS